MTDKKAENQAPSELDKVISAWLTPDKKTSLNAVLSGVEDLAAVSSQAQERIQELTGREPASLTEDEIKFLQNSSEILVAAASIKTASVQAAEQAAKETADKIAAVEEVKNKLAQIPEPAAAPAVEAPATPDVVPVKEAEVVKAEEKVLEPVSFRAVSSLPIPPTTKTVTGTALTNVFAADSAGGTTSNRFDSMADVGQALVDQMRSYPRMGPGSGNFNTVAKWHRNVTEEFAVLNRDDDSEIISKIVAKAPVWDRSSGQFAAGWCAPSETLYELCPFVTSLDGIVDLPEVIVTRGGVRTTAGPNFSTLYDDAAIGQVLTEAQVIAATEKICIEVDCPPFVETRLDVNPLCITGNLLTQAGYPEYVERFIREAIAANAHKINLNILTRMATASTAVTLPGATGPVDTSSASWFLDAASLYAEWLRNRYRLAFDSLIEVVAPHWWWQQMLADLARRNGVDLLVSEARLREAFAERNIRVQWVYDWQPMAATAVLAAARPVTANMLVYIPGTFVKLAAPVINLGTVHSAAQLATNQYTAMFVEDGFNVLERCFESLLITVPTCPSGTTGAATGSCDSTP